MPEQKMDPYFAVFNCHINKAKDKATTDFKNKFGIEVYKKTLKVWLREGIMVIFNEPPNEHSLFFVNRVTEYVNEGRV